MLQEIFYQMNWTEIIATLAVAVGGAAIVWYRKRLALWRQFWKGVLDGLRSIPDLQSDVRGIRYYVAPNGGGSLMDATKRMEVVVDALTEQVDLVVHTMWAENDSDEDVGRFHCNASGENTYVNKLYARWLGVGKTELLGWNHFNFIHPNDVDRVRKHWDTCRSEHRQFRINYRYISADGEVLDVDVIATPIPERYPAKRWVGSIRKVHAPS